MKEIQEKEINENSLLVLSEKLVGSVSGLLKSSKNEEELKIGFEKMLSPILDELSISSNPKYERTIITGRPDAVHGQVIIEYEPPHAFRKKRGIETAYEQLLNYIAGETKETLFLFAPKFVGIGFDGEQIFFVHFKGDKNRAKFKFDKRDFAKIGPYPFSSQSAKTLLIHLRGLARLPLTAENLADKFGPQSQIAPKVVSAFADSLENWDDSGRAHVFFNEWKRLFGIVYGEQFTGYQEREVERLSKMYKVSKETDFQELLFSVHTYFALLMKLIAAELLILRETALSSSLASELTNISEDELKIQLIDIEDGGIYARKGITNFLEGDFFRWYLDAWSPRLKEAIQDIARVLSEFEPATTTIDPESTRDLLKKLYQYLVPQEVRHRLGEYYTPDWLAELLLNEVNYKGDTLKRFLDPACGSGTFLVLAIQRAIQQGHKEGLAGLEIVKRIKSHIWGFDLNPLAVIASRTNYLFALGDLVNEILNRGGNIEIPVYLADSVLWPEQVGGQGQLNFYGGDYIKIKSSVKEFHVPAVWLQDNGELIKIAASLIERDVRAKIEPEIAMKHFKQEGVLSSPDEKIIENFYKEILELEKQNKNDIWARFLKNAFAPMVAGKFDFLVGNPPWIMWQYLSKEYREATKILWENYGLTKIGQARNVLIRGRRDFSMLFVYASIDYYLKDGAKLGFLITQEVFKSKGAGEGFRRFQLGDGKYFKILKAHDLVSVLPFEGAANKTAAIILKRGEKTEYPVPYIVWTKKKGVGKISTDKLLNEVLLLLQRKEFIAKPISSHIGPWQTKETELESLENIEGKNNYKAHRGTAIDPYGVFWLKIKQVLSNDTLLVKNLVEHSRRNIPQKEAVIEKNLVYPGLRGSDITRWEATFQINVLTTHPGSQKPYSEELMKQNWPRTYNYLTQFKEILIDRGVYKHFHEKTGAPFYGQRDFGRYTFSNYKVIWKRMSNDIFAAVVSEVKTPYGYKRLIPLDTTSFFAIDSDSEAYYLCAIINSNLVRKFIKSYSSAGRGFASPSVMEHVGIPKFDHKNKLHQKLAEISKNCHQFKSKGKEEAIRKLEKDNDKLVEELFSIK